MATGRREKSRRGDAARVADLMTNDPVVVAPDAPVAEAERLLKTYRISGLPVVGEGLMGVISLSDILVARSSPMISANWTRLRVRHVMSSPAVTIHASARIAYAAREMHDRHIHRLVVVDDGGEPVGVLSSLDVLGAIQAA